MPYTLRNSPTSYPIENLIKIMAKTVFEPNPRVHQIFDDLDQYLDFCQDFGYMYDESDLYNWKSYAYQQFTKNQQNKAAKDMWVIDGRKPEDRVFRKYASA